MFGCGCVGVCVFMSIHDKLLIACGRRAFLVSLFSFLSRWPQVVLTQCDFCVQCFESQCDVNVNTRVQAAGEVRESREGSHMCFLCVVL